MHLILPVLLLLLSIYVLSRVRVFMWSVCEDMCEERHAIKVVMCLVALTLSIIVACLVGGATIVLGLTILRAFI